MDDLAKEVNNPAGAQSALSAKLDNVIGVEKVEQQNGGAHNDIVCTVELKVSNVELSGSPAGL